ncbi:Transcription factor CPC [Camellia lanceoleosa]|uniref:Transcription factor CPC n=1 Tax=Camellia lanceoleosa TaxID=1840588 RepID=A0ACC0IHK1_9ERIC|nr:Transcription factor CPC [Camellia lanceoleosa]
MDKRPRKQLKTTHNSCCSDEVSSIEWEFINMSEQEEDLIRRMYKLVGNRWIGEEREGDGKGGGGGEIGWEV